MPELEDDEEQEETITERIKLNPQKRKAIEIENFKNFGCKQVIN